MKKSPSSTVRKDPFFLLQATRHLLISDTIRTFGGKVDLALVGDSLTEGWQWVPALPRITEGRKVLNFGLGGDTTANLLWRLQQDLLTHLPVARVALLIGINDCWSQPSADAVIRGVAACLRNVRISVPTTKVVLYGLLPVRGPLAHFNQLVSEINVGLIAVAQSERVDFRDISSLLREHNDLPSAEIMPDGVHLSNKGYEIWARDLSEWLKE